MSQQADSLPPVPAALGSFQTLSVRWASVGVLNVHLRCGPLNAMSQRFWREMRECATSIASVADVRVVWITAEGKLFTAGLDLQDHTNSFLTDNADMDSARRALRLLPHIHEYQESFSALERLPQPVVVSVQGACVGGGVDLIAACDIRLAAEEAWFSVKEVDVGMAADVGSLQRLPKIVGNHSLLREWCYTGRRVSAAEALQAGLVSRVLPAAKLQAESLALCRLIASKSPLAVSGTKSALNYARDHSVDEGLRQIAAWNATALQSGDVLAAMQAAITKQQPIFSNL